MVRANHILVAQQDRPFNAVFQLPHIARPVITGQHFNGRRRNPLDSFAVFAGIFFQKKIRQQHNIVFAVPQRRNKDRKDIDAIIQIFAEQICS